ncbi:MAG: glycosyltransferase family 2 protein [Planctomycetota bacterium]|jgi:hypothetical protein
MDTFLFYLAGVNLVLAVLSSVHLVLGAREIVKLENVDLKWPSEMPFPKVSIIVPARNEERNIEQALRSLLSQDYEDLEILVVDDRSSDRTGQIIDSVATDDTRVKVIHLTQLPSAWIGKNHALNYAAERATGQFLLFTDADVIMSPNTVRRAITYAVSRHIDHLSLWPEVKMPTLVLKAFAILFTLFFNTWIRPWKAKDPKSKAFVGIGAFNLITAQAYSGSGTHRAIAMRPDDDLKLGKVVKQHGYRQEMANGIGLIHIQWYDSVAELIDGCMKSPAAAVNYNMLIMLLAPVPILVFDVWPVAAVFLTTGTTQLLYAAVLLVYLSLGWKTAGKLNIKPGYVFGFPLAMVLVTYILWRAAMLTLINNGITWRGTHYSLSELKANKV